MGRRLRIPCRILRQGCDCSRRNRRRTSGSDRGVVVRNSGLLTLGSLLPGCRKQVSYVCVSPPCGAKGRN